MNPLKPFSPLMLAVLLLSGCAATPPEPGLEATDWQAFLSTYAEMNEAQKTAALREAEAQYKAAPDDQGRLEVAYLLSGLRPAVDERDLRRARRLLAEIDPESELAGPARLVDEKVVTLEAVLALEAQRRELEARYRDLSAQLTALEATHQALQARHEELRALQRQTQDQLDSLKGIEARMIESDPDKGPG